MSFLKWLGRKALLFLAGLAVFVLLIAAVVTAGNIKGPLANASMLCVISMVFSTLFVWHMTQNLGKKWLLIGIYVGIAAVVSGVFIALVHFSVLHFATLTKLNGAIYFLCLFALSYVPWLLLTPRLRRD